MSSPECTLFVGTLKQHSSQTDPRLSVPDGRPSGSWADSASARRVPPFRPNNCASDFLMSSDKQVMKEQVSHAQNELPAMKETVDGPMPADRDTTRRLRQWAEP
jgi:hypothetical protein